MTAARRWRWGGWGVLALIAALLAVHGAGAWRGRAHLRPVRQGDLAPGFALPRVTESGELGNDLVLGTLRGKVVVLDFWATWCGPCRDSMPALESLARRYADRGLVLVSINTEGPDMAARARAMQQNLAPSGVLVSDGGAVARMYRATTIPHIVVVDRRGVVRWVQRGFSGGAEAALAEHVEELVSPR